jgi:ribosomal protein S18 acetylase RimI-like enzyme
VVWVRPDGRRFVRLDELDVEHDGELYVDVGEEDAAGLERCQEHGFVVNRRESVYRVPTTAIGACDVPDGFVIVQADAVEEGRLRILDDALRQDVPGTRGWRWDEEGFRGELEQRAFDPATYLVAVEMPSGEYVGIVRVWNNPGTPRLGFIGVSRSHRRLGVARALLARAFAVLASRGQTEVTTEIDDTNAASRALLAAFGAERCGGAIELHRQALP